MKMRLLLSKIGVAILFLINLSVAEDNESPNGRIINGKLATAGQFPHHAAILYNRYSESVCGGSLISPQFILTAGHCVYGLNPQFIGLDTLNKKNQSNFNPIKFETILHENFNSSTWANDIALIKLSKNVTYTNTVKPIALNSDEFCVGQNAIISGWGLVNYTTQERSNYLKYLELITISDDECRKTFPILNPGVGCAKGSGSGCLGDSGGGLLMVVNGQTTHVGLASFAQRDCPVNLPNAFTKTAYFKNWIMKYVPDAIWVGTGRKCWI